MSAGSLNIVTDGLVFEVDAANKLGGVKDLTDPTISGNLINGTTITNGLFVFDGVDDYIDFGDITKLDLTTFTISAWFKGLGGSLIDKRILSSSDSANVNFSVSSSAVALNPFYANSGLREAFFTGLDLSSAFNSLNFTYDGVDLKLYFNGTLLDTTASTLNPSISGVQDLYLGRSGRAGGDRYLDGEISNVKIYNRALTQAEIKQNYEATKHKFE